MKLMKMDTNLKLHILTQLEDMLVIVNLGIAMVEMGALVVQEVQGEVVVI